MTLIDSKLFWTKPVFYIIESLVTETKTLKRRQCGFYPGLFTLASCSYGLWPGEVGGEGMTVIVAKGQPCPWDSALCTRHTNWLSQNGTFSPCLGKHPVKHRSKGNTSRASGISQRTDPDEDMHDAWRVTGSDSSALKTKHPRRGVIPGPPVVASGEKGLISHST